MECKLSRQNRIKIPGVGCFNYQGSPYRNTRDTGGDVQCELSMPGKPNVPIPFQLSWRTLAKYKGYDPSEPYGNTADKKCAHAVRVSRADLIKIPN
jgi:hypothetical protein